MDILTQRFSQLLSRRTANGSLRGLKLATDLIDFSSNDYLSFSQNTTLQNRQKIAYENYLQQSNQSAATGSRLLTGHNFLYESLENELVAYYNAEAALVVNSGYDANAGLLLACCRKTDLIIADELAHASLCDAMRWTGAETHFFRHNDTQHLEELLYNKIYYDKKKTKNNTENLNKILSTENQVASSENRTANSENRAASTENQAASSENRTASTENQEPPTENRVASSENRTANSKNQEPSTKNPKLPATQHSSFTIKELASSVHNSSFNTAIFVLIESVYSMDGDIAKLLEITEICEKYGAFLLVDEAHATGIFGWGLVSQLKLEHRIWARMHTFGKALGAHGAVILGSNLLKQYLLNFARPFIYTTALPPHTLTQISEAHHFLSENPQFLTQIQEKIVLFHKIMLPLRPFMRLSESAIQWFSCPTNARANQLSLLLRQNGFDVRPILSPTVAAGSERLRICLHLHNTEADFLSLKNILQAWID